MINNLLTSSLLQTLSCRNGSTRKNDHEVWVFLIEEHIQIRYKPFLEYVRVLPFIPQEMWFCICGCQRVTVAGWKHYTALWKPAVPCLYYAFWSQKRLSSQFIHVLDKISKVQHEKKEWIKMDLMCFLGVHQFPIIILKSHICTTVLNFVINDYIYYFLSTLHKG